MNLVRLLAMLLLGLRACLPAAGSVVFTTGETPPTFSTLSANAYQVSQAAGSFSAVAESFTPTATVNLGEIDLPVEYVSGTNAFTLEIESGAPNGRHRSNPLLNRPRLQPPSCGSRQLLIHCWSREPSTGS